MPIYEYRCENGHTFEVMQKMTDDPLTDVRAPATAPVQRVFHPVAVHFKGKGFYNTDYGTQAPQPRARARPASDGADKSTSSSSSDSSILDASSCRQLGVELEQVVGRQKARTRRRRPAKKPTSRASASAGSAATSRLLLGVGDVQARAAVGQRLAPLGLSTCGRRRCRRVASRARTGPAASGRSCPTASAFGAFHEIHGRRRNAAGEKQRGTSSPRGSSAGAGRG